MSGKIQLFVQAALNAAEQEKKRGIYDTDKEARDRKAEEIAKEFKKDWDAVANGVARFDSDLNTFLERRLPDFKREVISYLGRRSLHSSEERKLKEDITKYITDMVTNALRY